MKKKILISMVVLFNLAFLQNANSESMYLECEGTGEGVGVTTVDAEYFEDEDEYWEFLEELADALCENEFGPR